MVYFACDVKKHRKKWGFLTLQAKYAINHKGFSCGRVVWGWTGDGSAAVTTEGLGKDTGSVAGARIYIHWISAHQNRLQLDLPTIFYPQFMIKLIYTHYLPTIGFTFTSRFIHWNSSNPQGPQPSNARYEGRALPAFHPGDGATRRGPAGFFSCFCYVPTSCQTHVQFFVIYTYIYLHIQ